MLAAIRRRVKWSTEPGNCVLLCSPSALLSFNAYFIAAPQKCEKKVSFRARLNVIWALNDCTLRHALPHGPPLGHAQPRPPLTHQGKALNVLTQPSGGCSCPCSCAFVFRAPALALNC